MNFDDFKYNKKNIASDFAMKNLFFEKLKNKFFAELKKSTKHKDYFSKYDPSSVENFLLKYSAQKAHLAEYYEIVSNESYQNKELKYREHTENVFNQILQKKLWNIQLQWRAEKINIKEIRTTWDFYFWERHITSCPFLDVVTESEVELMKQFLTDDSYEHYDVSWYIEWQNYDKIMEKDEAGDLSSMPEWYEFYDNRMGTGMLLMLPDIRGKKEDYYSEIGHDYFRKEFKKNPPQPAQLYVQPPPHIMTGFDEMYDFAVNFEKDKHIVELFRINKESYKPTDLYSDIDDDQIYEAIELLKEADEPVIMHGGIDWREAVVQCARQYIKNIIAREIDIVFDEYKMLHEIGLSKLNDTILAEFENDEFAKNAIESIIKGRELCGEPPDLNF